MKILIIEDEYYTAEKLKKVLLELLPDCPDITHLSSVKEAKRWFDIYPAPDLIFQDIELGDGKCFEIYQSIEILSPVVFTTAYSEYALQAFELNSIDYLVKPYEKSDVSNVLKKFKKYRDIFYKGGSINRFNAQESQVKNQFLVKLGTKYYRISSEELLLIKSTEGVTYLIKKSGEKYPVDYTIDALEKVLDTQRFFRINRSCLICSDSIHELDSWFNSRLRIQFEDSYIDPEIVSRPRVKAFKNWLNQG